MAIGQLCRTSKFCGFGRCKSYLEAENLRLGFWLIGIQTCQETLLQPVNVIDRASARAKGANSAGGSENSADVFHRV